MRTPERNQQAPREGLQYTKMRRQLERGQALSEEQVAALQGIVANAGKSVPAAGTKSPWKPGPRFAPNVNQLAKALGCSRQLIGWHARQPGSPRAREDGRHSVPAWRDYLSAHGRLATVGRTSAKTVIGKLKLSQLALINRKLRSQLAVLEKLHTPIAAAREAGEELSVAIRRIVSGLHLVAPRVVGVSVPEAVRVLQSEEDRIMEQLHTIAQIAEERGGL